MSETQGGFKMVLVHSFTSQMSELRSTTTVELVGKKDKYCISIFFILTLRLSTLGSCSFWRPPFFLCWWKTYKNMSVADWIEPLKSMLHWDIVSHVEIRDWLNISGLSFPQVSVYLSLKSCDGNPDLEFGDDRECLFSQPPWEMSLKCCSIEKPL